MRSGGIVINLSRKFQALCGYGAESMVNALDVDVSTFDLSNAALDVSTSYECVQAEHLMLSLSQALSDIATGNKTLAETFYNDSEVNGPSSSSMPLDPVNLSCSSLSMDVPTSKPEEASSPVLEPLQTSPSLPAIFHPNNEITFKQFKFKSDGSKKLKKNVGYKRTYYKCIHNGCRAKYQTTMSP
jgi:hypothetical protein